MAVVIVDNQLCVTVQGVSHRYGKRLALADVTCALRPGVTGLLGPNGAGKSTLMKLVVTELRLQSGAIEFSGTKLEHRHLPRIRRDIGYLPQRFTVMGMSTVQHNVAFAAWAHGMAKPDIPDAVEQALSRVDLQSRAKERARQLSGGMRQRLGLACAMVHNPKYLILDEPTVGLDPHQRRGIREVLDEVAQSSVVLMSTHLVEDLADSASQILVMNEGSLLFAGDMADFRALGAEAGGTLESSYFLAMQRPAGIPVGGSDA